MKCFYINLETFPKTPVVGWVFIPHGYPDTPPTPVLPPLFHLHSLDTEVTFGLLRPHEKSVFRSRYGEGGTGRYGPFPCCGERETFPLPHTEVAVGQNEDLILSVHGGSAFLRTCKRIHITRGEEKGPVLFLMFKTNLKASSRSSIA